VINVVTAFRWSVIVLVGVAMEVAMLVSRTIPGSQSPAIVGRVVNSLGMPISGATVTTMLETGGIAARATSGPDGTYELAAPLQDGTHRVDFELLGFDLVRRNHVVVRHDAPARVDAALSASSACECLTLVPRSPLRERDGRVVDESGRPLAHARLTIVSPVRRETAYANGDGRFRVRLPLDQRWPLTVSDSGFAAVTQQLSGAAAEPIVFKLAPVTTTGLPGTERFARGCRCPDDLFTHEGR
jgi:hypothetical protein